MFGVLGPGHRESVCGLVTDPCTELVWGNSVGRLEQKCSVPAPWRTAVQSRVPAGLLSSRDCLPHGVCSGLSASFGWTVFGTPCFIGALSPETCLPLHEAFSLCACHSLSTFVGLLLFVKTQS